MIGVQFLAPKTSKFWAFKTGNKSATILNSFDDLSISNWVAAGIGSASNECWVSPIAEKQAVTTSGFDWNEIWTIKLEDSRERNTPVAAATRRKQAPIVTRRVEESNDTASMADTMTAGMDLLQRVLVPGWLAAY